MPLAKPEACKGCSFYQDGLGFVPDENKPGARVRVIGQNPGEAEVIGRHFIRWYKGEEGTGEIWENDRPRPLIGKSGYELDHKFLPLAGLTRDDVETANVIRCRWRNSNDLPPLTTTIARSAIEHCQRAHWVEPNDKTTMVALGAYALYALTGEYEGDDGDADSADDDIRASKSVDGWRGWLLPYRPQHYAQSDSAIRIFTREQRNSAIRVFATYHPAFYWRAHWLRPVGRMDFARLGRLLRGTWPEAFPQMSQDNPSPLPHSVAFDTEYNPWTKELHRYSIGYRHHDEPRAFVIEARDIIVSPRPMPTNIIMQNAEADWPYLTSIFGHTPETWDDTMFAHSLLYGTLRHSLDFMGSCYARHNRWKHLQQLDPLTYSGMDALATYDIWQQLSRELARDAASSALYEHELKPLLPPVMARPSIRLNAMHIAEASATMKSEQREIELRGQVAAGWPINVSSADQISRWLRLKVDPQ